MASCSPLGERKSKPGEEWMKREAQEDKRAKLLPKRCGGRWGAEQPEGRREGETHCSVTPAPEGVCAHTPAHTHSPGRALRRARQPRSAAHSAHAPPRPRLLAPGRRPPLPTPRKPLDVGVARHPASARRGRPSPQRAADAAPRREGARRVEARGHGGARGSGRPAGSGGRPRTRPRGGGGRCAAAGSRGGAGSGRQARRYLLARPAGRRAGRRGGGRGALGGVAAGDTLRCLEGAAGGGGRASAAPPQTSASGGDLLPPLPPWAYTQTPFFSHFIFSLQSPPAPGSPACTPNQHPQRTRRRLVPAMSLLFWDRSALAALSPPGEARSPGTARSLTQPPAARLGPLLRGPGGSWRETPGPQRKVELPRPSGPGRLGAQQGQVRRDPTHVPRKRLNLAHFPYPH